MLNKARTQQFAFGIRISALDATQSYQKLYQPTRTLQYWNVCDRANGGTTNSLVFSSKVQSAMKLRQYQTFVGDYNEKYIDVKEYFHDAASLSSQGDGMALCESTRVY